MSRASTSIPSTGGPIPGPTPEIVLRLQTSRGYPCVSVLMSTIAAPTMLPSDATRMRALSAEVRRRLDSEHLPSAESTIMAPLVRLVEDAVAGPTSEGIGVFVSAAITEVVRLPVRVNDRVVVDPTFATRDLVRALHRAPRHVVLVLDSAQARLFEARTGVLQPAVRAMFPLSVVETETRGERRTREQRERTRAAGLRRFHRRIDGALSTYLRLHPAPLVIVGPERVVTEFRSTSKNLARLAGTLDGNFATAPLATITARVEPILLSYLRSREREALALLEQRAGASRAASGIDAAWLAARTERPEMLAVEQSFFYPARISSDGDFLTAADDVEHPEVIDDAVDELIETVLDRGGWVALTEDGALADHGRVALTLHS